MTKTKINTGAAVENHRQKDQGNVSPKWIEAIQRQVKIGDTVNVKTNKCCSVDEGMSGKSGVWRKGTVIGIFRNFVYLQRVRKGDLWRSCDHPDETPYYAAYPLRMYEGREEGISNVVVYRD